MNITWWCDWWDSSLVFTTVDISAFNFTTSVFLNLNLSTALNAYFIGSISSWISRKQNIVYDIVIRNLISKMTSTYLISNSLTEETSIFLESDTIWRWNGLQLINAIYLHELTVWCWRLVLGGMLVPLSNFPSHVISGLTTATIFPLRNSPIWQNSGSPDTFWWYCHSEFFLD